MMRRYFLARKTTLRFGANPNSKISAELSARSPLSDSPEVGKSLLIAQLILGHCRRTGFRGAVHGTINHFPGGLYALATRAAFSRTPLNSLDVHARTVSILDTAPLAAAAIPIATASDPSGASVTSTTSCEPVVL